MEIRQITENKGEFMPLLLLGDEQEELIYQYLDSCTLFALYDPELCAVCALAEKPEKTMEIKNLAVAPHKQRKGYGRAMLAYLEQVYRDRTERWIAGTGESPLTLPFYEACGFRIFKREENFFLENYDHPIFEAGVQLKDRIYLEKKG